MKSGKIFLMIFIILSSAIGLAVIQDFVSDESQSVSVYDFFSQTKTKKIQLSDGVGTDSKG
jgi:hypothetical protein